MDKKQRRGNDELVQCWAVQAGRPGDTDIMHVYDDEKQALQIALYARQHGWSVWVWEL